MLPPSSSRRTRSPSTCRSSASRTARHPDDAPVVTQYEMHGVEELGLLKMDFLGLRNLSVIERALDLSSRPGRRPDIDAIALDDPDTFAMLRGASP